MRCIETICLPKPKCADGDVRQSRCRYEHAIREFVAWYVKCAHVVGSLRVDR
jgi:hypothetical protein